MIIRKLTASFGKLQNDSLSFHDGLNVIYAPNESGKSTWCAFIQAMLYGVDSSERVRNGYLPDKLRYAPWSGAPMEGSMELTADNCDITITRRSAAKGAPMRDFTAVYTGTNSPVEGMNGANAGELLTGVNKELFRRSAFISQGAMAVSGSPELEKRISAIVTTGEEQTSYTEANERLRSWQRARRFNRHGLLPELEGRMDESQRSLDAMSGSTDKLEQLEEQLEQTRQACSLLEQRVTESRKQQRRDALNQLSVGRSQLRQASDRHDAAMAHLATCRDALQQGPFGDRSSQSVSREIKTDMEEYQSLRTAPPHPRIAWITLALFLLAVIAAAVYSYKPLVPLVIVAGVLGIAAVSLLLRYLKAKQDVRAAADRRQEILRKYHAAGPADVKALLEKHLALRADVSEAEQDEYQTRQEYADCQQQQTSLEENALSQLDFSAGTSEAARLGRDLAASRAKAEQLSAQIATLSGRMSAMGDPLVLASNLSRMREEYDQIQSEFDAITLAADVLKEADAEIQSRFSPELGRLAARYMSLVTGGRYEDVLLSRDFTARTRTRDDAVARQAEYLSAGTLDLMYLAVRLAVCELALPEGEPCPLILDDALVNLDEERLEQAMDLLKQIARERQVILFTCRQ